MTSNSEARKRHEERTSPGNITERAAYVATLEAEVAQLKKDNARLQARLLENGKSRHSVFVDTRGTGNVLPFVSGSSTSRLAAESMTGKAGSLRRKVYDLLSEVSCTDEEGAKMLDMNPSTYRPRRVELSAAHLIQQVGEIPTSSGRRAVVWGVDEK